MNQKKQIKTSFNLTLSFLLTLHGLAHLQTNLLMPPSSNLIKQSRFPFYTDQESMIFPGKIKQPH